MSLCDRCEHCWRYERRNHQATYYCSVVGTEAVPIPGDIERCSDFSDRNTPSKYDMEKIAWRLRTDKSGKIAGFAPPAKKADDY